MFIMCIKKYHFFPNFLMICIPEPPAVSPNPCMLSPISIRSN